MKLSFPRIVFLLTLISIVVGISLQLLPFCHFISFAPDAGSAGMQCSGFAGSQIIAAIGTVTNYIPLLLIFGPVVVTLNIIAALEKTPIDIKVIVLATFGIAIWGLYLYLFYKGIRGYFRRS